MSGTELIMGMGEVINYLKQLEEENKKLKESDKHLNKCIDSIRDQYLELKEENEQEKEGREHDVQQFQSVLEEKGQLEAEVEELKEENKKLKEANDTFTLGAKRTIESNCKLYQENKKLKNDLRLCGEGLIPNDLIQRGIVETCREKVKQLEEEKDKLKEENERLRKTVSDATLERIRALDDVMELNEEKKKLKNKLNVSEIKRTEAESELESFQNFTRDFDYEDNYNDWLKGNHDDYSGSWLDNWYSEHFDKYEDGDDWDEAYGYTVKDGEYRISMAGGGEHWEDYVMTKEGCFIHNKEGKKKVFTFVSCPNANYIKVWDTPDMEGGLVLDEGEKDLYEIIKDAYEEEIMNYVLESEDEDSEDE